jgi:hypothetical protein
LECKLNLARIPRDFMFRLDAKDTAAIRHLMAAVEQPKRGFGFTAAIERP